MGFYDEKETAEQYVDMAKGYDGAELIEQLKKYIPADCSLLELGMGPGIDLQILSKTFKATGSDNSEYFVERYKNKHANANVIILDAVTMQTPRRFDAIYSNKVLHHLDDDDLAKSFIRQQQMLNTKGHIFHSFWNGSKHESHCGMDFYYRSLADIALLLKEKFKIIQQQSYEEMEPNDSHWVLAQKV